MSNGIDDTAPLGEYPGTGSHTAASGSAAGHEPTVIEQRTPPFQPRPATPVTTTSDPTSTATSTEERAERRHKATTDRFHASLGLFLLRLVTAAILGIHGYQHLSNHSGFKGFLTSLNLPSPEWMAWGVGIAEVLAAAALLFGLVVRVTGICVTALMVGILARVLWQHGLSIHANDSGFKGELELLLATVGFTFFMLGGGRWGIDGAFRAGRSRNR